MATMFKRGNMDGIYISPANFWGQSFERECSFNSEEDAKADLRQQYDKIVRERPKLSYPTFEDCVKYSQREEPLRDQHVECVRLVMIPA